MSAKSTISKIPTYSLYGESIPFPDILHCERISDRAQLHDWDISPHRHMNLHQVFLVTQGLAKMTIDGQSLIAPEMCAVSVPQNCVHGFKFEKHTKGYVLSIPSTVVLEIIGDDLSLADLFSTAKIIPASDSFIDVLKAIHQEQYKVHCARRSLLRGLAIQLACHLASSADTERQSISPMDSKITDFEKLAYEHFSHGWKVSDFAKSLGISTTHLNRLSQEILGQSPKMYLLSLVIQEAKRLLAYTKIDVAGVGYQIGFEDPSYFSRTFMRQTGQSPSAFRNMYLQE